LAREQFTMIRKFSALLAALVLGLTTLAPTAADARDRRGHGYYDRGHHGGYGHHRRYRDRDDGDAIAAGAVGLILGLAIGSMASEPRGPRYSCRDNYQRCAPPPRCSDPCGYGDSYYREEPRYRDEYYDDRGGAYEREYGYEGTYDPYLDDRGRREQCTRRERQWDRYANRYVTVDVPC
jgi:hypothetical protein